MNTTLTKTDANAILDHICKMEKMLEDRSNHMHLTQKYDRAVGKLCELAGRPTPPKTAPVKYIIVKYEERDGEHEYGDSLILKVPKKQNIPDAVHNYFKTMYGDDTETQKKADSYEESPGWRICTIDRFETIPEADALILAKHNTLMLDMTAKTTNHIVIVPESRKDGQELFEDIQNKYSLYDNCVSEEDGKRIVIEGANTEEVQRLVERITKDFTSRIGAMDLERNLPMTDSIIDNGRDGETGGMEV
jgi:hypothetical protein